MKRTGKILCSMAAAGAAISAAVFMAKKLNARHGKPVPDTEPDDGFVEDEEYFPDFLQDGFGMEEETDADQGIYLTADEAGFLRYILEGIENIGILTDSVLEIGMIRSITCHQESTRFTRLKKYVFVSLHPYQLNPGHAFY